MYINSNCVCCAHCYPREMRAAVSTLARCAETPDPYLPPNPSQLSPPTPESTGREHSHMLQAQGTSVMSEINILILKSQRQGYKSNTLLNVASNCEHGKCSISLEQPGGYTGNAVHRRCFLTDLWGHRRGLQE